MEHDRFHVFIETPAGSRQKRTYDERTLQYRSARPVPVAYPHAYGFLPGVVGGDGESLDCFIISDSALEPGCRTVVRVLGMIEQFEGGTPDHKVITSCDADAARCLEADALRETIDGVRAFMVRLAASRHGIVVRVGQFKDAQEALAYIGGCGSPTAE